VTCQSIQRAELVGSWQAEADGYTSRMVGQAPRVGQGPRMGKDPRIRRAAWTTEQWSTSKLRRKPSPPRPSENDQRIYWQTFPPDKGPCQRIKDTIKDYCNNTTLHGLRYTTTTNTKHWFERYGELWLNAKCSFFNVGRVFQGLIQDWI